MFVLLQNKHNRAKIIVGNAHFEHSPQLDYVKFAQAVYFMKEAAKFCREKADDVTNSSIPFISGGDFNSLPVSSALSVFYNEQMNFEDPEARERNSSVWQIPFNMPN